MQNFSYNQLRQSLCIILLTLLITPSIIGCSDKVPKNKEIIVIFRYDDYSSKSNTDLELKIIDAFRKIKKQLTIAVIPYVCSSNIHEPSPQKVIPLTKMKADILKNVFEAGVVDIALHGYSHQTVRTERYYSEFFGLDYNRQFNRISAGKTLIRQMIGTSIVTFVPPWNTYDHNTLRTLEALNFQTISADLKGEADKSSRLNYLPATCPLFILRDTIKSARLSSDVRPVIVVFFHEFDFKEISKNRGKISFHEFSDLLEWIASANDIRMLSINQTINQYQIFDLACYYGYQLNNSNILPIYLRSSHPKIYGSVSNHQYHLLYALAYSC
jgi:predicted deacetylase